MPDTSTPVTTEELQAAFRKSRLYFQNIGFLRAMEIPALRLSLQLYAIHLRKPEGLIKPNAAELFSQKALDLVSAAAKCAVTLDDLKSKSCLSIDMCENITKIVEETHDACKAMGYPYCDEDTGNPPNKITDHFQWRTTGTPSWIDEGKMVEIKNSLGKNIVGKLTIQYITPDCFPQGENKKVAIFVLVKDDGTKHAFIDHICWRFVYQDTEDEVERARRLVGSGIGADK